MVKVDAAARNAYAEWADQSRSYQVTWVASYANWMTDLPHEALSAPRLFATRTRKWGKGRRTVPISAWVESSVWSDGAPNIALGIYPEIGDVITIRW